MATKVKLIADSVVTTDQIDLTSISTTSISEGDNLYYTDDRFDTAFSGKSSTDLTEGTNLYYTDARFDTRLATKTTTDLSEGTNLYWTTARGDSNFSTNLALSDTDDLSEGATNLYYTDARVGSYLTANSYATQSYVSTAVSNLVDSAPGTLDTLNELAAALGDDANFSTTVTNSIATKWTQDNTKISNWDTAYGWGNHASAGYLTGNQTITLTGDVSGSGTSSISVTVADDSHNHVISNVDGLQAALDAKLNLSGGTLTGNLAFSNSGTTKRGIRGTVGSNDFWFFGGGATASNAGYVEIAAGDDGSTAGSYEPIYVRQYLGDPLTGTVQRTLTLLDNNGNTDIPNDLAIGGDIAAVTRILFDSVHQKDKIKLFATGHEWIGTSSATLELSGDSINLNAGQGAGTPNLKMGGTTVIDASRNLQNVSINASDLDSGTVNLIRLPGNLSGIASTSADDGLYFRGTTEKISGESYATAFYAYNQYDGFLFLNRDGSNNAKAVFHIGGYNNAPSAGYASEDTVITISRNDSAKANNLATGLSASSYRSRIVKTTAETVFDDTQGKHRFDGAVQIDGNLDAPAKVEVRQFQIDRAEPNAAIWWQEGNLDINHVLWNNYYGGPTTRGGPGSGGFDGMLWNTYQGLRIRGGIGGPYNIARFDTDGSGGTNTHYVRLYQANAERFRTTSAGISVTGAVQIGSTTVIDSSRNLTNIGTGAFSGSITSSSAMPLVFYGVGTGTYTVAVMYCQTGLFSFEAPLTSDSIGAANVPIYLTWRGGYGYQGGIKITDGLTEVSNTLRVGSSLQIGSTTVIDSSRNLTNISGITASNAAPSAFFLKKTSNATHNGVAMLVESQYGNHSWGMVGELRVAGDAGSDDPSLLFSQGYNSNTWSIGFGYNDHSNFRINKDHGHRNGGWGTAVMTMDRSGNVTFAGNVTAYSDERLKDNIQTIHNALDAVKQLRGVTYNWKETGEQGLGVIAQEVEAVEITKCLVSETPEDGSAEFRQKNVAYGNMVGLLIEAVKEQQTQIEALQAKLKELENGNH